MYERTIRSYRTAVRRVRPLSVILLLFDDLFCCYLLYFTNGHFLRTRVQTWFEPVDLLSVYFLFHIRIGPRLGSDRTAVAYINYTVLSALAKSAVLPAKHSTFGLL